MKVTFAKEYSAIHKDLLHYLGLRKVSSIELYGIFNLSL